MAIRLRSGEQVLAEKAANLFRGIEAVGGRMTVTNQRIFFEPHMLNIQTIPAEIPLAHVAEVGKRNTLGIIPNGLSIITKGGEEYRFVVWGRERLIDLIQSQLGTSSS